MDALDIFKLGMETYKKGDSAFVYIPPKTKKERNDRLRKENAKHKTADRTQFPYSCKYYCSNSQEIKTSEWRQPPKDYCFPCRRVNRKLNKARYGKYNPRKTRYISNLSPVILNDQWFVNIIKGANTGLVKSTPNTTKLKNHYPDLGVIDA